MPVSIRANMYTAIKMIIHYTHMQSYVLRYGRSSGLESFTSTEKFNVFLFSGECVIFIKHAVLLFVTV